MRKVELERLTWFVAEGFPRDQILASLSAWPAGEVLRQTPSRSVRLLQTEHGAWVVKHFHHGCIGGILKSLVMGTPAAREWKALLVARDKGLPSARALALGEQRAVAKRESMLVTQSLEQTFSLADYLRSPQRWAVRQRWQVARAVASLVRKAHDLGFCHRDLHAGNILLRARETAIEAYLIDLQRASIDGSLSLRKRCQDLAIFHGGCTEASRTQRIRFLKHYVSLPPVLALNLGALALKIERSGLRYRHVNWRKRQKRCLRENRDFARVRLGSLCGFARREPWEEFFASLVSNDEGFLKLPGAELVKDSKTTTVAVAGPTGRRFYIKRYNYQSPAYAAKDLFRSSRARRTWIAANSLHMRGIPVALPLLYLERRRWGILCESYFFTAARSGVMVRDIFRGYDKQGYRFQEKRILLDRLARFLKAMHARGVAHRDLKGTNLIVQAAPGGTYDLSIVDFDGIHLGPVSWRRRIKNLARAAEECHRHSCFTRTDRLRFLKAYLGSQEVRRWKSLWLSVTKKLSRSGLRIRLRARRISTTG